MRVLEGVTLASLTTFKVGGPAALVVECENEEDIKAALMLSHERGLPWYVIGGGSNLVAPDEGFNGVIVLIRIPGLVFKDADENGNVVAEAGAGVVWDEFVQQCTERELWGVENLAGIPGTVGAAPVQNIGAYGAELADTLLWVEVFDTTTQTTRRLKPDECEFAYRESIFKRTPALIIIRVACTLSHYATPRLDYADLKKEVEAGVQLDTPTAIAQMVRKIRSGKFPDLTVLGTAGSFIKNPTISEEAFAALKSKYPELPGYETPRGVKIPIAWILDHVLNLKGYGHGHARFYEKHALVIVAEKGATARDIDELAKEIESKVLAATGIVIEREVRMMHNAVGSTEAPQK